MQDFSYFDSDPKFLKKVSDPLYLKYLIKSVLYDTSSQTNQALIINNFYLCQKLKKLIVEKQLDLNKIWRSQRGSGFTDQTDPLHRILLGMIPFIDQCDLWKCTKSLQEIAHQESMAAIDYMTVEVGTFLDLFQGPDWYDKQSDKINDIENEVQENIRQGDAMALEEVQMLNDMAQNGQIDASLTLFNMYLQGDDGMGIDRDARQAQRYLDNINNHINQNGLQNLKCTHITFQVSNK